MPQCTPQRQPNTSGLVTSPTTNHDGTSCIGICLFIYVYMCLNIFMYRERERSQVKWSDFMVVFTPNQPAASLAFCTLAFGETSQLAMVSSCCGQLRPLSALRSNAWLAVFWFFKTPWVSNKNTINAKAFKCTAFHWCVLHLLCQLSPLCCAAESGIEPRSAWSGLQCQSGHQPGRNVTIWLWLT